MNKLIINFIIAIFFFQLEIANAHILPQPTSIVVNNGKFIINKNTIFHINQSNLELKQYANRFVNRLQNRSGIFFINPYLQDTISNHCVSIVVQNIVDTLSLEVDESYQISITKNKIELKANSNIGAYRGMETLLQLIKKESSKSFIPNATITDKPRFPWRGLMIDVCRHWVPIHVIKRNIDAMAAVKLNVLHLHLTEDQAFRIESKTYPKLHLLGNDGNYYTQDQIKEIVTYAHQRGIRVIPEFDLPGHATSWLIGYPELASEKKTYVLERNFGVFNPTLDPTKEETYYFLQNFLSEMSTLFPDQYMHIGGDENNGVQWDQNSKIQRFKKDHDLQDNKALQAYFNERLLHILTDLNKKMIGWDEIFQDSLPKNIAIQSWRGKESLYKVATQNYPGILSNGFYLDKAYTANQYYENDPLPTSSILEKRFEKNILGGEATMWTELVNERTIDSRIWPVSAAIAERLWSDEKNCNSEILYLKLSSINHQLEEHGLQHLSYQNALLKEISGTNSVNSITTFVRLLEPIKGYSRHRFFKYNTHYPLNRLVDACYTESYESMEFNTLVNNLCKQKGLCRQRDKINSLLKTWVKSVEDFIALTSQSPALNEAKPLAYLVLELCELSIQKINSPAEFSEEKEVRAKELLIEIKHFNLDVEFAPVSSFEYIFK